MRPTVLMVPGFSGSGPDHWQSIWERDNPEFRRLEQRDWDQPEPEEWSRALEKTLRELPPPVFLVAHSLGCNTVAHWAKRFPSTLVAGAFLVAPADVEAESTPEEIRSFAPVPLDPLPFPGLLLFSEDDPYISSDRARAFARAWGSTPISMGMAGHLNTASGHGPWPEGRALLQELLAGRLTSQDLAALVVDALIDGGVIQREHADRAIEITTEEIEVRKALGDY